jgi:hypothetical protein
VSFASQFSDLKRFTAQFPDPGLAGLVSAKLFGDVVRLQWEAKYAVFCKPR